MTDFSSARNVRCKICGFSFCPEEGDCPECADRDRPAPDHSAEKCLRQINEIIEFVQRPSIDDTEADTILAAWRLDEVLTEIKGLCDKYAYMTGAMQA